MMRWPPSVWLAVPMLVATLLSPAVATAGIEILGADAPALLQPPIETPALQKAVASGDLPPVKARLPRNPRVLNANHQERIGSHGGEWRMLVGREKDVRLLAVYGYARLVGYTQDFDLVPDILESVEIEDGRIFTLKLREGHRWSDGHPFTTEDFRYWWEDMANNPELSPTGPPRTMLVDGEAPKVTFPDATTVRYAWSKPNPFLLPALAGARPLYIYAPAHYLRAFHERYAAPEELAERVEEAGARNWAQLHNRKDNLYRFDNPELPVLQPWHNTTGMPATRFILERNPFFHRVDAGGRQLPYIDRVLVTVTAGDLIPVKAASGDADLQARGLNFNHYTVLKQDEERGGYDVRLWPTVRGSELALYPNLNVDDPVWRELVRDVRFRRALSLSINRRELNQVVYFGLGQEGNQSVLPESPLYRPEYRSAWAEFDLEQANALLDEIGLTERNDRGFRLLPDGRPMEIVVETAGENPEEVDILQLIADSWGDIGIRMFAKPLQREVLRNRIFAGETLIAMWFGYENGVPTADMSPQEFVPVQQHSYQWSKWGQYYETSGQSGEPVDMPAGQRLLELYDAWLLAPTKAERREIWHEILEIQAEEVFTIGLVARIPQPVVVANDLRNVPEEAIYNWDPGAQFGVYHPDTFWYEH
jgi:peptide/nickel transport system substrate-binding protein